MPEHLSVAHIFVRQKCAKTNGFRHFVYKNSEYDRGSHAARSVRKSHFTEQPLDLLNEYLLYMEAPIATPSASECTINPVVVVTTNFSGCSSPSILASNCTTSDFKLFNLVS
jgi:hypothetical protein